MNRLNRGIDNGVELKDQIIALPKLRKLFLDHLALATATGDG